MTANETITILEWLADHFHIIGWTGLGLFAWRGRGYIDKFMATIAASDARLLETQTGVKEAVSVVKEVKAGVDTIQTNHLGHMEDDMSALAEKQDASNLILTSIDKNISILVDRGRT